MDRKTKVLVDLFTTVVPKVESRIDLFNRSLDSLSKSTNKNLYRLTVILDGDGGYADAARDVISSHHSIIDHVIISNQNQGLGPSVNKAISYINCLNEWESDKTVGDKSLVSEFICYSQDDVLYSKGWLEELIKFFTMFEKQHNLGFASGHNAIEHKAQKELVPGKLLLKQWIRATNVFGRREYWNSLHPIPKLDPETGRTRGKPNDGLGSSVDWWWIRNAENSICKTGRTCLVIPGLVQHLGFNKSTWLNRELPESKEDLEKIL